MMTIVLTRHGETEWNLPPVRFRGRAEVPLTDNGRMQAGATADAIGRRYAPVAVYASPLGRCVETATTIAKPLGLAVTPLIMFTDIDYGKWEGLTFDEARREWPDEFLAWTQAPHLAKPPLGESLQDVLARVANVVGTLAAKHRDECIVLVGHDSVNRVLLLHAAELPLARYRQIAQDNCCINEIRFSDAQFRVQSMNETLHLPLVPQMASLPSPST